ncbi:hypothetical protein J3T78_07255 [Staphylococcus nepalensis]|uniref:Uncharacterized protein n=1 Tax=Staphylococcus nepalensis TaxID=214473 RepID=A0ABS3L5E9_9STAP|nr:hypothetical protein [Staphylococcus nepalensis]MBO1214600.1 hypothetical protein [Staphylococcus nepalensis]MBO1216632.1 hypothetical protein [Staphylococcus nepalensis]MBO1227624.1 hypothetical protein [Staphylococcus nepalensis]MBO1235702.1 hypothetical protein [Staphylococcus nepalensis]MBO1237514.1 hypothetical protein [Staphylococcus nepalensis]
MSNYSLNEFKKDNNIITDEMRFDISNKFEEYIELFNENPLEFSDNEPSEFKFEGLISLCKHIDFNSIPYARLTDLIFQHDELGEYFFKNGEKDKKEESGIAPLLKSKFDSFVLEKYSLKNHFNKELDMDEIEDLDSIFRDNSSIEQGEIEIDINEIKIIYKMFEHIELAEAQKLNLFIHQKEKIKSISHSLDSQNEQLEQQEKLVKSQNKKIKKQQKLVKSQQELVKSNEKIYSKVMSSFISILGIFSAILMGAFGGIKGFTSLFSTNKNLIDLTIIATMGFIMLMIFTFLLLNSISKMTGEKLYEKAKSNWWFTRHPTLIISLSLAFCILFLLTFSKYHEAINKTLQINNFWLIVILSLLPFFIFVILSFRFRKPKSKKNKTKQILGQK